MLQETGEVIDKSGGRIIIEFSHSEACSGCAMSAACVDTGSDRLLETDGPPGIEVGDRVEVLVSDRRFALGWILLYLMPTAIFMLGLIVGRFFGDETGMNPDIASFLLSMVSVSIYFIALYLVSKILEKRFMAKVRKIVE